MSFSRNSTRAVKQQENSGSLDLIDTAVTCDPVSGLQIPAIYSGFQPTNSSFSIAGVGPAVTDFSVAPSVYGIGPTAAPNDHMASANMMPMPYNLIAADVTRPMYPQLPGSWLPDGTFMPAREVVKCSKCVLYPPNPNARPPTTRERPPGCRTLFVGGLPENMTQEMVRDVFQRCGEISALRVSKNFAHVRYELEVYVEYGLTLSGYRVRVHDEENASSNSRLHCDYAQARDDQHDYECRQRAMQRQQRHRQRRLADQLSPATGDHDVTTAGQVRPPSPALVPIFTQHECHQLMDAIKSDATFERSAGVLAAWLERGDCSKRSVAGFYSMIQSTNSHVRRLMSELIQIEDEVRRVQEHARTRRQHLLVQFGSVERVFAAANQQKVWDHLSKAQRRNIALWSKQAMDIKGVHKGGLARVDDDMEMSDDDQPSNKRGKPDDTHACHSDAVVDEASTLQAQLVSCRRQLQSAREQHDQLLSSKQRQLDIMNTTMHNVQQQLLSCKSREQCLQNELTVLKRRVQQASAASTCAIGSDATLGTSEPCEESHSIESHEAESLEPEPVCDSLVDDACIAASSMSKLADGSHHAQPMSCDDARIVGLVSSFLNVHPDGASCHSIWSYMRQFAGCQQLTRATIDTTLARYPSVFGAVMHGVGATVERRWSFVGYTTADASETPCIEVL